MHVRLVYKESWALKNWYFWTVVLKKTFESHLNCKEIKPVNPKRNQSWIFIGKTDAVAETPVVWPPDAKNWLIGKYPDAAKDWRWEEKGMTEDEMVGWHHWLNGHEFDQALEAWRAAVHGGAKSQTGLSNWSDWLNSLREGFPGSSLVKNLPMLESQETWVRSLSWEDPLEEEMAIHSGILAWKILWTEEPGGLQFMSLQRVRHDWATEQLSTSTNSLRNENSVPIHIIKHILTLFFSSLLLKRFITNKKHYQLIIIVGLYHISNNTTTAKNFPWNLIEIKCLNALSQDHSFSFLHIFLLLHLNYDFPHFADSGREAWQLVTQPRP